MPKHILCHASTAVILLTVLDVIAVADIDFVAAEGTGFAAA